MDAFTAAHPNSSFTQCSRWRHVKPEWDYEAVVSEDDTGSIRGALGLLIRRMPLGSSFLYAPRGPVCDLHDREVLGDLKAGCDAIARRYKAYALTWDPDTPIDDSGCIETMSGLGFEHVAESLGFEAIQARFNYRLDLAGLAVDEVLANITQKTRYNIRLAAKKGVEVRVCGADMLLQFMPIMETTGDRDGFGIRPLSYFENFLGGMGEYARLYMAFVEDTPVAGAIATNFGGKVSYVYGASDNTHRNLMPTYLVQWAMIEWAVETGCRLYDFMGVTGDITDESSPTYGLYRFKKGFNGRLDELVGEFTFTYKPLMARLVTFAMDMRDRLSALRGRLRRR